jgi:ABC-2 type transport system permease protein
MKTIFLRETRSLFNTFSGYFFVALFLFGGGIIFAVTNLAEGSAKITQVLTGLQYILLIITPLLTYRLFAVNGYIRAGYSRKDMDRTILSSPISSGRVALGKFLSAFSVFIIALLLSMVYPVILAILGSSSWGETLSAFFGLLLYGGTLISIGVFLSALFSERKAAATVTLAAMLVVLLIESIIPDINNTFLSTVVSKALPSYHLYYFVSGILYLPSFIYFISITALFIFLSGEAMEHRKWSQV